MDFRSIPCVFLGHSPTHHGYRCIDTSTNRIYIARLVRFNETVFPFTPNPNPSPSPPPSPYYSSFPNPTETADTPTPSPPQTETNPTPPNSTETVQTTTETAQTTTETATETTETPTPTSETPTQPQTRYRPPNLRQNPKQTTRFNPSAYQTSTSLSEPTTFTVANKIPEWQKAMFEEYQALVRNGTWSLVPYVENTNVIDSKWVYRLK